MAVKRRPTTYQYEPLVTPSKWQGDELRFSVRLTQILDDLYQKFSSLRTGSGSASVAIADDANKLGGVEASKYALKTGTVANANKLGGKAPEYYLSPRNLLDNSDFRNPVNQRGVTSFAGGAGIVNGYISADRWLFYGTGTAFEISDGIKATNAGTATCGIAQRLMLEAGKTYTLACKAKITGTVYLSYGINGTANTKSKTLNVDDELHVFTFTAEESSADGLYNVRIRTTASACTIQMDWIALYEGSYTADTLPPYVPKGYAAELLECKRYFIQFKQAYIPAAIHNTSIRRFAISFLLDVPMVNNGVNATATIVTAPAILRAGGTTYDLADLIVNDVTVYDGSCHIIIQTSTTIPNAYAAFVSSSVYSVSKDL